jgi:hypothetical protein
MVLWLLSFIDDPWAVVKAWRQRRDQAVPPENKRKPTFDAYPRDEMPPEVRFYVEARDVKGRLLREYVELDGYSVHQLNWKGGAMRGGVLVRDWFVGQMLEALIRLEVRLDLVRDKKVEERP